MACWVACILTGTLCAQPRRLITGPIQDARRSRMTGHVHPLAKAENDLGPLDASETLPAITLVLRQVAPVGLSESGSALHPINFSGLRVPAQQQAVGTPAGRKNDRGGDVALHAFVCDGRAG